MNIFECCSEINDLLLNHRDGEARDKLFVLLDYHLQKSLEYTPLINSLIRQAGLYPYLHSNTASWQERVIYDAFKVDSGGAEKQTLHREQSSVLKLLLAGKNIAVSAPTSFGKSFVIDAFIAIKKPKNVIIIVPTIALMDEVRRRLFRKFSRVYQIITTTDATIADRNLFVFPQERAVAYVDQLVTIDLLVVDEFYKASSDFDRERSPALLKAILKLGKIAKQRYYLAPNIGSLADNAFTHGMEFIEKLDFSTVYLKQHHLYRTIQGDETKKSSALIKILKAKRTKTLIYAASYKEIDKVITLLTAEIASKNRILLTNFSKWLGEAYGPNWNLTKLVTHGIGVHNGQIHRSLSQIQLKLFEAEEGLDAIVSTSSIIEGVNTSAESVVLWKNRKGGRGNPRLDTFTYKNIIGRGGRMFKYFVGQVYLLEEPPDERQTQLDIEFPNNILGGIDENEHRDSLSNEQISKIISFRERMTELLGVDEFKRLYSGAGVFQASDSDLILKIAEDMVEDSAKWNGLAYLNSPNPEHWQRLLYVIINLQPGGWDIEYAKFVKFVCVLSKNWEWNLPRLLVELKEIDIGVNMFFKLERNVTFKMAALFHDVNELQKTLINNRVDISGFVTKLSHAFLPSVVYQLEEYGLPRMLSRKIQDAGIVNFEAEWQDVNSMLKYMLQIGRSAICEIGAISEFEKYIIHYFFDGIESNTAIESPRK